MTDTLLWALPFIGILVSLSTFPLFAKHFWHNHYGKVVFGLTMAFVGPFIVQFGTAPLLKEVIHLFIKEYFPFLCLIGVLFVVTSGIRIKATWMGGPMGNTGILFIGTVLASIIGTTGASMVLIRPILAANQWRTHKAHTVIFFIFLVANIGGALSPMGDAPLFLGFLEGVPFLWPLKNLSGPTFLSVAYLLIIFFVTDFYFSRKESGASPHIDVKKKIKINGKINLIFLGLIVTILFLTTLVHTRASIDVMGTPWLIEDMLRDFSFILITFLSFKLTKKSLRKSNHFTWEPLREVAKIFAGIFVTMLPLLSMLKMGSSGLMGPLVSGLNAGGEPQNALYFWATGLFSSFLDNAPSYLIFFHMAGGHVDMLTSVLNKTLMAISLGAVYMGAVTYVGNAPNFMIRAIAERERVDMPSFFGYALVSALILGPLFFFLSWIYFN